MGTHAGREDEGAVTLLSKDKVTRSCNIQSAIQVHVHDMVPILNASFQHTRPSWYTLVDNPCIDAMKSATIWSTIAETAAASVTSHLYAFHLTPYLASIFFARVIALGFEL